MQFSDLIDQQRARGQLTSLVQQGRLSHALLLLGPEGCGGLPLALAFAQYIVCTDRSPGDSCGKCNQCKKAAALVHPDIHFSYPAVKNKDKGKEDGISTEYIVQWRQFIRTNPYGRVSDWIQSISADNKQGNINAAECHDILRKLSYKSFESQYKILLMWMPEFLEKEGNRLLKLLEEPPPGTIFLLIAQRQEQVLPTIVSRTQLVKLSALPNEKIMEALMVREGVQERIASQISRISEGNYAEAIELVRHGQEDLLELLRGWLNAILHQDVAEVSRWVEQMAAARSGRETQKNFLRYFITLLEHALRLKYLAPDQVPMLEPEIVFAGRLNARIDFQQTEQIIGLLDEACYQLERNANSRILFQALSIRLKYVFTRKLLPL
jgi:DNA polymerase-3 subunit delta'